MSWLRDDRQRRLTFLGVAAVLCVLTVFPRHYVAEADLLPKEPGGGLSAILSGGANGGLLSLGDIIGQRTSIEADLAVARSHMVALDVIQTLKMAPGGGAASIARAEKRLRREVSIEALRGSIIQISVRDSDPDRALEMTKAYSAAIQSRLGSLNLDQAVAKRQVAQGRLTDASIKLTKAQSELAQFRNTNKLAAPMAQLGEGVSQLGALQARLQAQEVQLATLQHFATGSNVQIQAVKAEIQALQTQIQDAETKRSPTLSGLPGMAQKNDQYLDLFRNEQFAETLYGIYTRYLESTEIDELTAQDSVTIIDSPYLSPDFQFNFPVVALLALLIAVAATFELYVRNPPPGDARLGGGDLAAYKGTRDTRSAP